jgi:hypothetical protein
LPNGGCMYTALLYVCCATHDGFMHVVSYYFSFEELS